MKSLSFSTIIDKVADLVIQTSRVIPGDVVDCIKAGFSAERNYLGRKYLSAVLENIDIAAKEKMPVCQDTGLAVFFIKQGNNVLVDAGGYKNIEEIINEGLKKGSRRGFLRNSVVDPLDRLNTNNNAPAVVHFLPGEKDDFEINLLLKGFGSENTSALKMLKPTEGKKGIEKFVIQTVKKAGSLPCPPVFIGLGIGGSFEKAAILSKFALCGIGTESRYREWETEMLEKINGLNIGAGGFGGRITALDIRVETFPTHIAGLPAAVNISCWAHRFGSVKL